MNRDDVLRMASEAGMVLVTKYGVASATPEWLERFAALVAAAEREACAKVCDDIAGGAYWEGADLAAAAIRARGES